MFGYVRLGRGGFVWLCATRKGWLCGGYVRLCSAMLWRSESIKGLLLSTLHGGLLNLSNPVYVLYEQERVQREVELMMAIGEVRQA